MLIVVKKMVLIDPKTKPIFFFFHQQMIDGEAYPPLVSEAPVDMIYPPHVPEEARFAVGHEIFGLVPGLMLYGTLWLREHNRVCDILHADHPKWDDERIFQTARLILIGTPKCTSLIQCTVHQRVLLQKTI